MNDLALKTIINGFKYIPINRGLGEFWDLENKVSYVKDDRRLIQIKNGRQIYVNKYTLGRIKNNKTSFIPNTYLKTYKKELLESDILARFDANLFVETCNFKVKGYIDSGKAFKYTKKKRELLDKWVDVLSIDLEYKLDENGIHIPTGNIIFKVFYNDKKYKFLSSDIEVVYPNFKGFITPKDRIFNLDKVVKIKDDRGFNNIKKGDKHIIRDIKSIGNKKYVKLENLETNKIINKLIPIKNIKIA